MLVGGDVGGDVVASVSLPLCFPHYKVPLDHGHLRECVGPILVLLIEQATQAFTGNPACLSDLPAEGSSM